MTPETLPCYPCPHKGVCCTHGADLTREEATALTTVFGPTVVKQFPDGSFRTALRKSTCVFHNAEGLCTLHHTPMYPVVCRAYPWEDGILGGPYTGDRQECPEFRKPE